ncbi:MULTISPECIES: hypothetical protein [unclassified Nonomuraea]|uniref:hypothetical protein n=1 Tax=unclassified Nonomuraea TaxID=2593643 RepID=UPI0033CFE226
MSVSYVVTGGGRGIGRVASPAEVAGAVAYVLGDDSGFVSGVTLPVDGGRSVLGLDPEGQDRDRLERRE